MKNCGGYIDFECLLKSDTVLALSSSQCDFKQNDQSQGCQDHSMQKRQPSTRGTGKTEYPRAKKNETAPITYTTYKN